MMNEYSSVIDVLNAIKGKPKASDIDDLFKHLLVHARDKEWIDDLKDGIVKVGRDGWMDGWMDGWKDEADGWIEGGKEGSTVAHVYIYVYSSID